MLAFANPRVRRSWARNLLALALGATTLAASAATVVVGGYDPTTKRAYVLKDLLVSSFLDGQPITQMKAAYSQTSKSYYLMRAGRNTSGLGCRKEFFRLVPVAGNQLAIADPSRPWQPWDWSGMTPRVRPTSECGSLTCVDCLSIDGDIVVPGDLGSTGLPGDDVDVDNPRCSCNASLPPAEQGGCNTTAPGWSSYHVFQIRRW